MPAQYKLIYFDAKGRAETIRLAFAAAGVAYEDVRNTGEQWKKMKEERQADIFLGQLPVLEVKLGAEWKVIPESGAVLRYIAREHDLYGKNNFESSMVDAVIFQVEEIITNHMYPMFIEKDEEKKKTLAEKFNSETLPKYMKRFGGFLERNKGSGWLVGNKISIADISVFALLDTNREAVEKMKEEKGVLELMKRVESVKGIKEWLAKRPKTAF